MDEINIADRDLYKIIVSDNFATGEGRTVYILITRAYPHTTDYDEDFKVKSSSTPEFRAMREFIDKHGAWVATIATFITKEDLLKRYKHYLPEYAIKLIMDDSIDGPGNFNYSASFHVNYS